MNKSTTSSVPTFIFCPRCEKGRLRPSKQDSMSCDSCSGCLSGAMLQTLRHIAALPDAFGRHACECGHPEMRQLPDGTYHCPSCGAEVLPCSAPPVAGGAYLTGWLDGLFDEGGSFVDNPNLARWEEPSDRLDYYRGHRTGSEARKTRNIRNPGSQERLSG